MSIKVFFNKKGGVAKTTTAVNTSAIEAKEHGKKVLIVALDANNNTGQHLGFYKDGSIAKEMMAGKKFTTNSTKIPNLDIVLGSKSLANVDSSGDKDFFRLRNCLDRLVKEYDEINIDCPSNLGYLTLNALVAADFAICPLEPSIFAINGLVEMQSKVAEVQNRANPDLRFLGVLLVKYLSNITIHNEAKEQLEQTIGGLLFKTTIRQNIALGEAQSAGEDILDYKPKSNAANDYKSFVKELYEKITLLKE